MRLLIFAITLLTIIPIHGQDFRYGKVSKAELEEKQHPEYPGSNAAVLYRKNYSHFLYNENDGFKLESEFIERIKIYNPEGFKYATKIINLYKNRTEDESVGTIRGVTYNLVNGKIKETKLDKDAIFEDEQSDFQDQVRFTMPNLSPGAVIEFKYTVTSPFLGNLDEIRFQEEIPVNKAEAAYYFPEYLVFKMHQKGWLPLKIEQATRGRTINLGTKFVRNTGFSATQSIARARTVDLTENSYDISVTNAPPLVAESFSGNLNNYASTVKFELSYTKFPQQQLEYVSSSWEDVAKTIYESNSFGNELSRGRYFEKDVDPLLSQATSNSEKVQTIFNYVKSRMTWNSHGGFYAEKGVKDAYKEQSGNAADINLMLVAMLRHAGLKANPMLISTKSHGIPLFPTRNGFNYVIAAVKDGDDYLLMDATDKAGQINMLDEHLLNWNGRIIREDGTSDWVSLASKKHSERSMMLSVMLSPELEATASVRGKMNGYHARGYRKEFSQLNEEAMYTKLEELNHGVELADLKLNNLNVLNKPVTLSYSFEPSTGIELVGDKVIISPMFHLAMSENPFKSEERKYPIDYEYPRKNKYIISIKIPENYTIESLPESGIFSLFDNMGKFSYIIKKSTTGTIQLLCEQTINKSLMGAEVYTELKKFYDMIVEKENEKIVLTKI